MSFAFGAPQGTQDEAKIHPSRFKLKTRCLKLGEDSIKMESICFKILKISSKTRLKTSEMQPAGGSRARLSL